MMDDRTPATPRPNAESLPPPALLKATLMAVRGRRDAKKLQKQVQCIAYSTSSTAL